MSLRVFIVTLAAAIAVTAIVFYAIGSRLSAPVPAVIGAPPASLEAESAAVSSESGSTIYGWLSRGQRGRGAVLLLPGVRANRLSMVKRAEFLHAAGYATMLIDFQATGESPGEAITFGWRERLDVIAAVNHLRARLPDEPIAIIGSSLGGAATLLAAPPLRVHGVVLEAVYPSIEAAVANRMHMRVGSIGSLLAPLLVMQMRPRFGVSAEDLRPIDHIAKLHCPVLVIAGSSDRHTTPMDTAQLFEAAWTPKELWMVPDAGHVDLLEFAGDKYRQRILAFLERAFGRTAGTADNTPGK